MSLFSKDQSFIGIDIGNSAVKIVELKLIKGRLRLVSYGFAERNIETGKDWTRDTKLVAAIINKVRNKAGITNIVANASLPTFSVFSSVINLTGVNKKDLAQAVHWEAKKVIPLPLEEMVLNWEIIKNGEQEEKASANIKILLTGAPKSLVKKYLTIFNQAGVKLISLETETFALVRSLIGNDPSTIMIVEFGASTTDISIVKKGVPILNRSIDLGGANVTQSLSQNLNVSLERAEQFKCDLSSLEDGGGDLPDNVKESVNPMVNEIKYVISSYSDKENDQIEKIILSGGSCLLPNLAVYLSKVLDKNVVIGDPWSRVSCPVELVPALEEIGPKMAVAVGLAMRSIE